MGADSSRKTLDAYAEACVKHKASQLIGKAGFTVDDLEDLEQELAVHLFEHLPRFDPARGAFSTFVDRVVDHKAADILDARFAARRDCRIYVGSIDDTVRLREGGEVPIIDLEDAVHVQRGISDPSPHAEAELRIDLERAMAALTSEQRDLCRRLLTSTIAEISAATGVPRPTLYDRVRQIKAAFERAGLQEYVKGSDIPGRLPVSKEIPGFGFRRVDQIALQIGTPKEHPSRLRAGVLFCVRERLEQGDCWVGYEQLVESANSVLALDILGDQWGIRNCADKREVGRRKTFLSLLGQQDGSHG